MFDLADPKGVMIELADARKAHPNSYIRLVASDSTRGFETLRMSFLVNRPQIEPTIKMIRQEVRGRTVNVSFEVVPA